jgi:hypothetical protein
MRSMPLHSLPEPPVSEVPERMRFCLPCWGASAHSPEQSKFDMADVHVSTMVHGVGQNVGGVLREGRYINRDATKLQLIEDAWGVPEDTI